MVFQQGGDLYSVKPMELSQVFAQILIFLGQAAIVDNNLPGFIRGVDLVESLMSKHTKESEVEFPVSFDKERQEYVYEKVKYPLAVLALQISQEKEVVELEKKYGTEVTKLNEMRISVAAKYADIKFSYLTYIMWDKNLITSLHRSMGV